jgi:hypothetical protein
MIWIAPSEKDTDNAALEKRLGEASDQSHADFDFQTPELAGPNHASTSRENLSLHDHA